MLREPTLEAPVTFGRYELVRRIGAGGMGEVYLARDQTESGPRAVVIKKVLPHLLSNSTFVTRFLDEAKVACRMVHPNIAGVLAMGEVSGEYFLAMEYVRGKTVSRFAKRLRERKAILPLGQILLLGERICTGLQYAHTANDEKGAPLQLVHRDLSPANICVSYRGEVKIIDFGASQSTLKESQTAPRIVIGNLTYMAPEQAKKQHVDHRADVYSCGVVLWELLAWYALPQKGDPVERWRKAANPVWEPPSQHRPSIPKNVDDVILKALHADPRERHTSASEFGAQLKLMRLRYAPEVTDIEIGTLLSKAFRKEKVVEDAVLAETLEGRSGAQTPTDGDVRLHFAPPTALAFEHTVVLAPAKLFAQAMSKEPSPMPKPSVPVPSIGPSLRETNEDSQSDTINATRSIFGVDISEVSSAKLGGDLIKEVEGDSAPSETYVTAPWENEDSVKMSTVLKAFGLFIGACVIGFGAFLLYVWLHGPFKS